MARRKPEDERDEFERAMRDVVRLPADPRGRLAKAPTPDAGRPPATPPPGQAPAPDAWAGPGVDRRELRRLKRGDYEVQARLDLHGMTALAARGSIARFLQNSAHARHRCVCIVHGRGLTSPAGVSVLTAVVREELTRSGAVLAFAPAPRSHGGAGAVFVLLRR